MMQRDSLHLQHELDVLERRLQDGERRIEEAAQVGADIDAWTTFWLELLHRYEDLHRRLTESDQDDERKTA